MRHAPKTIKQWWTESPILPSKIGKLIILRTRFSVHTKNKNIGEGDYTLKPKTIYHILVYVTAFLLISIVQWQSQSDQIRTSKLPHWWGGGTDDGNMMFTQEWGKRGFFPCPLNLWLQTCNLLSSWWATPLPTGLYLSPKSAILINSFPYLLLCLLWNSFCTKKKNLCSTEYRDVFCWFQRLLKTPIGYKSNCGFRLNF